MYGFYRAGALTDVKARHISYAGHAACEECHAGTYDAPDPPPGTQAVVAKVAEASAATDNKHLILRCEACHGPLAAHADDPEKAVPKVIGGQLLSKSLLGYTTYKLAFATREGLLPAILMMLLPFGILAVLLKVLPPWDKAHAEA